MREPFPSVRPTVCEAREGCVADATQASFAAYNRPWLKLGYNRQCKEEGSQTVLFCFFLTFRTLFVFGWAIHLPEDRKSFSLVSGKEKSCFRKIKS